MLKQLTCTIALVVLHTTTDVSQPLAADTLKLDVRIKEVDAFAGTITLERNKTVREFTVADDAKITIGGAAATLEELEPEAAATILFNRESKSVIDISVGKSKAVANPGPLFDGKSFTGWKWQTARSRLKLDDVWSIDTEQGVLRTKPGDGKGMLLTEQEFESFDLSLQWRLPAGGGTSKDGVGLVVGLRGDQHVAFQINATKNTQTWVNRYEAEPVLGEFANAQRVANLNVRKLKQPGQWNTLRVKYNVDELIVIENDIAIVQQKGVALAKAPIALRPQGTDMEFHRLELKTVDDVASSLPLREVASLQIGRGLTCDFSQDGEVIAAGGTGLDVGLYAMSDGQLQQAGQLKDSSGNGKGFCTRLRFSPDGKLLATAANDGTVCLFKFGGLLPTLSTTIQMPKDVVDVVVFSPSGRYLALGARTTAESRIYDLSGEMPKEVFRKAHDAAKLWGMCFSQDEKTLTVGLDLTDDVKQGELRLFDITQPAAPIAILNGIAGRLRFMANVSKTSRIAFTTVDSIRTAQLSATKLGDLASAATPTAPPVAVLAVHPSSTMAAWASMDGTIKVGNLTARPSIPVSVELKGIRAEDLRFSSDGTHLTSITIDSPQAQSTARCNCGLLSSFPSA